MKYTIDNHKHEYHQPEGEWNPLCKHCGLLKTTIEPKESNLEDKDTPQLRNKIAEILVKWNMPTRQAAINEIMELLTTAFEAGKKEEREGVNKMMVTALDLGFKAGHRAGIEKAKEIIEKQKDRHQLDGELYEDSGGGRMCEICGKQNYSDREECYPSELNEKLNRILKSLKELDGEEQSKQSQGGSRK